MFNCSLFQEHGNIEEASLARNETRVKFQAVWKGSLMQILEDDKELSKQFSAVVGPLSDACWEMEKAGVTPVHIDGKVGGNASVAIKNSQGQCYLLVTKSGKLANQRLSPESDVSIVTDFSTEQWAAEYHGISDKVLPTSDTPMHWAAFKAADSMKWNKRPVVILHGHALETEEAANKLGLPISTKETLFSTPPDTEALLELFEHYPYPKYKVFIRKGHGFMLLAESMEDAVEVFRKQIKPYV